MKFDLKLKDLSIDPDFGTMDSVQIVTYKHIGIIW